MITPTLDDTGLVLPSFDDIRSYLEDQFRAIYGNDIYILPDSQDGQWIGLITKAIYDSNLALQSVFLSFRPDFAIGAGLSSLVQINGLTRKATTRSVVSGYAVGTPGTIIINGRIKDRGLFFWDFDLYSVTIGNDGHSPSITCTCTTDGDNVAITGDTILWSNITGEQINGWTGFTIVSQTVGPTIESDADLRSRQLQASQLPSVCINDAILSAVSNTIGVTKCKIYENDTALGNTLGIPAHSLAVVVDGGNTQNSNWLTSVANAILLRKAPGVQTFGLSTVQLSADYEQIINVNFSIVSYVPIYVAISITPRPTFYGTTLPKIQQAVVDFITSLEIGDFIYPSQIEASASLLDYKEGRTFYITKVEVGTTTPLEGTSTLPLAFNEKATCQITNVTFWF